MLWLFIIWHFWPFFKPLDPVPDPEDPYIRIRNTGLLTRTCSVFSEREPEYYAWAATLQENWTVYSSILIDYLNNIADGTVQSLLFFANRRSAMVQHRTRAVDSLYADPDPAVFLNADPDPGPAEPNLKKKNHEEFSQVVKNIKDCSKVRNNGACANLL